MSSIRPYGELVYARLASIGIPASLHSGESLRQIIEKSTGVPPRDYLTADELARDLLAIHELGRPIVLDAD